MPLVNNFYISLIVLAFICLILQSQQLSLVKKGGIILMIGLVVLWFDRPDWFVQLLWKVGIK